LNTNVPSSDGPKNTKRSCKERKNVVFIENSCWEHLIISCHWTASPRNRHFNNLTKKTEFLLSFYDLKICFNKDLQKESKSEEFVSQSCKFAAQRKKLDNIPLPLTDIEITSGTFYKIGRFIVYLLNIVSLQPDHGKPESQGIFSDQGRKDNMSSS
jgi:hypothetical protein